MSNEAWVRSHRDTDRRPRLSFVVVADTHVNEADGRSTSPYRTNALANERARWVFHEIAGMQPAPRFVVHLGDIVHPVPSLPTYATAIDRFREIAAPLAMPLHLVPGNHDVGDKPVDWMPAEQVCDTFLARYREAFGHDHYAFDEGGLRFVVLNSLLLNSGLADEERQRRWLESLLDGSEGRRVMVFMHYPPFIHSTNEPGNYDNVDEPARSWLLRQLERPMVEAVFAGHVHNFWVDRIGAADFYMLPSTAFLRHDFAEFFRVAPTVEFGRGATAKFGYFVVDVFEDGHVAYAVRTHGRALSAAATTWPVQPRSLAHPATSGFDRIGVQLRHPWAESQQITATGGVQEFGRKWARNDYPLLALWEMGCRLAMVPEIDLHDGDVRRRMALGAHHGLTFLVTSLRPPTPEALASLPASGVVGGWEFNATSAGLERARDRLQAFAAGSPVPVYWSRIHGPDDAFDGTHFSHFVKSGFLPAELQRRRPEFARLREQRSIGGITVRVDLGEDLLAALQTVRAAVDGLDLDVLVSIKTAGPSIAASRDDDRDVLRTTVTALLASQVDDRVRIVFDTFMDVDRGYSPRHGFIDRSCDPRAAAVAFATLVGRLSGRVITGLRGLPGGSGLRFEADGRLHHVLHREAPDVADRLAAARYDGALVIDLATGVALDPTTGDGSTVLVIPRG